MRDRRVMFGLLAVASIVLGVIISLLVQPSFDPPSGSSTGGDNVASFGGKKADEAAEVDPIDQAIDNVMASAPPEAPEVKAVAIPRQFWGIWTQNHELCGTDVADDTVLEISGRVLRGWETSGAVKSVVLESPMTIKVDASYIGGGENWDAVTTYALSGSRQELVVTGADGNGQLYQRCPAA